MGVTASVLLAAHNAESYLPMALDSIAVQKGVDWELIAIDDGSTDATPDILRGFQKTYAQTKVLIQPHSGLTASLNAGLAKAEGEFIARLDADDLALPGRLASQVAWLNARPHVALVGSNAFFIDGQGRKVGASRLGRLDTGACRERLERLEAFFPHSSWLGRTKILRDLGAYDEFFAKAQDFDLSLRCVERFDVECMPDRLVALRRTDTSVSHDAQFMQFRYAVVALILHWQRQGKLDLGEMDRAAIMEAVGSWFDDLGLGQRLLAQRGVRFAYVALRAGDVFNSLRYLVQAFLMDPAFVLSRHRLTHLRAHLLTSLAPYLEARSTCVGK